MTQDPRFRPLRRMAGLAVAAGAFAVLTGAPARAFDDRPGTFGPIWNFVTGGEEDKAGEIDFRERPKLVVPKNLSSLPPPQPGSENGRAANWPKDQDVVRRARAREAARAPQQIDANANPVIRNPELLSGRSSGGGGSRSASCQDMNGGTYDCSRPERPWEIGKLFGAAKEDQDVIAPGQPEPSRVYLTEPPRGYRSATRAVKATREAPRDVNRDAAADPRAYLREQNQSTTSDE